MVILSVEIVIELFQLGLESYYFVLRVDLNPQSTTIERQFDMEGGSVQNSV